jgi:hypothetical protein
MNRMKAILSVALAIISMAAFAQATPTQRLILEYVEGEDLQIKSPGGQLYVYGSGVIEGDEILVGSEITTGPSTYVELKIVPNGTIIKLTKATTFRVEMLAGGTNSVNTFTLVSGKIRSVAAKNTGQSYTVQTSTTVCAVRGTDFTLSFEPGKKASVMVAEGQVAYGLLGAAGDVVNNILVGAGQFADGYASTFAPASYTAEQYSAENNDTGFTKLDSSAVPGSETAVADTGSTGDTEGTDEGDTGEPATDEQVDMAKDGLMKWLSDVLGMEIGSITIGDTTYSKAVLQPHFTIGELKVALYLPIIYTKDLFNPEDWYQPAGNNEWDFGGQQWETDPLAAVLDAGKDLLLKFKSVEYGDQMQDPFYLKVGNIGSMTLGHGLVMYRYANDHEFPAVRKLGFNIGFETPGFVAEAMISDVTDPEIFGGRFGLRIIPDSLTVGITAVTDLYPARELADPNAVGDPVFIGAALDFDLPILMLGDFMTMRAYVEGAVQFPWYRTDPSGALMAGPQLQAIYDPEIGFNNFGVIAGVLGNVLFIDYRLEMRYFRGTFKPNFYGPNYDLARGSIATDFFNALNDPTGTVQPTVFGIYGEGGFALLDDKLILSIGYMWPWSLDAGLDAAAQLAIMQSDYLHLELVIGKGLIPFLDIYGSITYDRTNFVQTLFGNGGDGVTLFDGNTTLQGEVVVPIPDAPGLALALIFATTPARDENGVAILDAYGNPVIEPAISIESRISF